VQVSAQKKKRKQKSNTCLVKECKQSVTALTGFPLPIPSKSGHHKYFTVKNHHASVPEMRRWRTAFNRRLRIPLEELKGPKYLCKRHIRQCFLRDCVQECAENKFANMLLCHPDNTPIPKDSVAVEWEEDAVVNDESPQAKRQCQRMLTGAPAFNDPIIGAQMALDLIASRPALGEDKELVDLLTQMLVTLDVAAKDKEREERARKKRAADEKREMNALLAAVREENSRLREIGMTFDALVARNRSDEHFRTLSGFTRSQYAAFYEFILSCFTIDLETELTQLYWVEGNDPKKAKRETSKMSLKNQIFLTLVVLRTGMTMKIAAIVQGVGETTMRKYFTRSIDILRHALADEVINWNQKHVREMCPEAWKEALGTDAIRYVLDSTNIDVQVPGNLQAQRELYSSYYSTTCVKINASVSPTGFCNYISRACVGSISDDNITRNDFFSKKGTGFFEPGDKIMADKGYVLRAECAALLMELIMPPRKRRNVWYFSLAHLALTKLIANKRIHVERLMRRLKLWRILGKNWPLSELDIIDDVIFVIARLANYGVPLTDAVQ
jgi:hypothetical protein